MINIDGHVNVIVFVNYVTVFNSFAVTFVKPYNMFKLSW